MRVLSVRQPWASLIASGRKTVELRCWTTEYRGPVIILAGGTPWRGDRRGHELGPLGVSLCVAELVDVRLAVPADAAAACVEPPADWYAWTLRVTRQLPARPVKGLLGLYVATPALLEAVGLAA